MGRPNEFRSFDAFTPTGNGPRVHVPMDVPVHVARYKGRPPYLTSAKERARITRAAIKAQKTGKRRRRS